MFEQHLCAYLWSAADLRHEADSKVHSGFILTI